MLTTRDSYDTVAANIYAGEYPNKDYTAEAMYMGALALEHWGSSPSSWLDVCVGDGRHARTLSWLFPDMQVVGVDRSQAMLDRAAVNAPDAELIKISDMKDFKLQGRTFDVITCLFASINYLVRRHDLYEGVRTIAGHLNPGGLVMLEPMNIGEFAGRSSSTRRGTAGDGSRFTRTSHFDTRLDPDTGEGIVLMDSEFSFDTPVDNSPTVEPFVENHTFGTFKHQTYIGSMSRTGLEYRFTETLSTTGANERGLIIGFKPPDPSPTSPV